MDGSRFDQLARSFSLMGTRRGLVRGLVTLPGIAGHLALVDGTQDAAGRRRRKRKGKRKKKRCRPQPLAETCAEKCGTVKNNCKKSVDCGSCECGACPICQICDTATGECVPDAGEPACGEGRRCCGGVCCEPDQVCATGAACCTPLMEAEACAAAQASGQQCGPASDGCGGSYNCACPNGVCQTCRQGTCQPVEGQCDTGNPCTIFDTCDDGVCTPGTAAPDGTPCPDRVCCDGQCAACCEGSSPCRFPDDRCCGSICYICKPPGSLCGGSRPDCACVCCSREGYVAPSGEMSCV